jgi:hypothetical protein
VSLCLDSDPDDDAAGRTRWIRRAGVEEDDGDDADAPAMTAALDGDGVAFVSILPSGSVNGDGVSFVSILV